MQETVKNSFKLLKAVLVKTKTCKLKIDVETLELEYYPALVA